MAWYFVLLGTLVFVGAGSVPSGPSSRDHNELSVPGDLSVLHYHELREMMEHLDHKLDDTMRSLDKRVAEVKTEVAEALLDQRKSILSLMKDKLDLSALSAKQAVSETLEKDRKDLMASIDQRLQKTELSLAFRMQKISLSLENQMIKVRKSQNNGRSLEYANHAMNVSGVLNAEQNDSPVSVNMTSLSAVTETFCSWSSPNAARAAMTSLIQTKVNDAIKAAVPDVTGYPDDVCAGTPISVTYDVGDLELERPRAEFALSDICEDGWTVFLRRKDGSVVFTRTWEEYAAGFGNQKGEFWLGNRKLHELTTKTNQRMRVELEDRSGEIKVAEYSSFLVDSEKSNFTLHVGSLTLGADSAGDALGGHNNMVFSTVDRDNDNHNTSSCATSYKGGFWYNRCHSANPTGLYLAPGTVSSKGATWYTAYGEYRSMKRITMKLRPTAHL